MKIQFNKTDTQKAIVCYLKEQGMNLEGKVVTTERVKDLIHVNIVDEGSILEDNEDNKKTDGLLDDE